VNWFINTRGVGLCNAGRWVVWVLGILLKVLQSSSRGVRRKRWLGALPPPQPRFMKSATCSHSAMQTTRVAVCCATRHQTHTTVRTTGFLN
jgi:hypothetical protein